jgi:hypothetical protein
MTGEEARLDGRLSLVRTWGIAVEAVLESGYVALRKVFSGSVAPFALEDVVGHARRDGLEGDGVMR